MPYATSEVRLVLVGVALASAFCSSAPVMADTDQDPTQTGVVNVWHPRWGLIVAGATLTALTYVLPCAGSGRAFLCVPVAGPIYEAARRLDTGDTAFGRLDPLVLGSIGLAHAAGIGLILVGLASTKQVVHGQNVSLAVLPVLSSSRASLQISARW